MTEASENAYLVRVRAQVMCRDEATGGWLALGGGGLAHVMIGRRSRPQTTNGGEPSDTAPAATDAPQPQPQPQPPPQPPPPPPPPDYYIHGRRISDNMMVLECTIKKDFQYNKVMPTFHHWVSEEKRFGLTFQTAADARAFDKGVRMAIADLFKDKDGKTEPPPPPVTQMLGESYFEPRPPMMDGWGGAWPVSHAYKKLNTDPNEEDEANIFECLNLPTDSHSSSENSTATRDPRKATEMSQILTPHNLPAHMHPDTLKPFETSFDEKIDESEGERCPYVHLTTTHEYTYPPLSAGGGGGSEKTSPHTKPPTLMRREPGTIKKQFGSPPLPDKKPAPEVYHARRKCRHCHEWYIENANRRGACEFAPDCFRSCIECVTCMKCARCMLYHCMADSEGDFALHPCACRTPPDISCTKRWLGVTLLSLLVPCLCCYLPLKVFHRAAKAAHLAGGQHAPSRMPPYK